MAKNNDENMVVVYKIDLAELLNSLNDMYSRGINFVDLAMMKDPKSEEDVLRIGYKIEYLDEDALDNLDVGISNEDLDKLINKD